MKKKIQLKSILGRLLLLSLFISCSSSDDSASNPTPVEIIPTDIEMIIDITGVDASNPDGDGSGQISVQVTANNAVRYGVKFGNDDIIESPNGIESYVFTQTGTNNYVISVFAYSSTDNSISTFETITVFVDNGQYQLIWSDEFNISGTPDDSKWTYDIGDGGWGNSEEQYYTNRPDNIIVEDGRLKIVAQRESYMGSAFTSARLKTQDIFDFKYGKVEVRAKLPASGGTWPAIWMLGSNIQSIGWPRCGEIDIMEQTGADKELVKATCHWYDTSSSSNASYGLDTNISDTSSAFHVYSLEWTESLITISVDDNNYYEIALNSSLPFNNNFFLILNVALGGTLGGTIDSGFLEDTMEIDYVRVYQ